MAIEGIDAITYSTDQWSQARRFFNDWGLTELVYGDTEQCYETLNGAQVRVRQPQDATLPPPIEAGPTLREVTWGVESDADLAQLAQALQTAKGFSASAECVQALDPHGLSLVFQRSTKHAVTVQGAASNPYGNTQRINAPSPIYERATPVEIGHVVLFTDRLDEAVAFYQSIGFVLSDSYPGRGAFLRCAATAGHHDVFLLQVPGKAMGLNHVAFTVRDIHEVFGGGLAMGRAGWKTQLGPGRHPISSAYFWYFENPCGGLIEYNADEDQLTDAWQAREFTPGPTVFAEWAVDGGIDGHTRRQPSDKATPSGAFLTEKKA
jgi:catechol 2,3-dioxygenase-like lactoylglutathione lyase family enzyme